MFFTISEFARKIGVTATTVRNWESQGIITPHHRSPNGYRYYTSEQVDAYFNGAYTKPHNKDDTGGTKAVTNDS